MTRSPNPILEYQHSPQPRQRSWLWALFAAFLLAAIMMGGIAWKTYVVRQRQRQMMLAQQKAVAARNQAMARQGATRAAAARAGTQPSR